MSVGVAWLDVDVKLGGPDAAAFDLAERHRGPYFQGGDSLGDGFPVGAGIGQRAHEHVAADS